MKTHRRLADAALAMEEHGIASKLSVHAAGVPKDLYFATVNEYNTALAAHRKSSKEYRIKELENALRIVANSLEKFQEEYLLLAPAVAQDRLESAERYARDMANENFCPVTRKYCEMNCDSKTGCAK